MRLNVGRDLYLKGRIGWRGLSKDEYLENGNYRIINATALMDGYVDWNNCGYISKERYEESDEIMLQEGDILISKDGTLGKIGYVKYLTLPCTVASGIFVLRNTIPEELNFDYLYHVLKSNIFKDFINRNKALGSTILHLYQRDLENFELELPSYEEQTYIADVLNSIDSKIENNNRIINTVEELTRKVYEFWFLQFNFPDSSGQPYKLAGGEMIRNDFFGCDVPKGWEFVDVEHITDRVKVGFVGTIEKYYCNEENGVLLLRTSNLTEHGIDYKDVRYVTREFFNSNKKSQLKKHDILIARHGDNGKTCVYEDEEDAQALNVVIIVPLTNNTYFYLNEMLNSDMVQKQIKQAVSGSVQGVVNTQAIANSKIVFNEKIALKYSEMMLPFYLRMEKARKENRYLTELHDFLLPLLVNGRIHS